MCLGFQDGGGYAVDLLLEAQRYRPECRGFDPDEVLELFDLIFTAALCLWGRLGL